MKKEPNISDICMHLGESDPINGRPVIPPIYQTSLFTFEDHQACCAAIDATENKPCFYTRGENPTIDLLCKKMAVLEGAEDAYVMSSGMGAISNALYYFLRQDAHVILLNNVYPHTTEYLRHMKSFGVTYTNLIGDEIDDLEQHIQPNTTLIWMESPGTMMFRVVDIDRVVAIAKKHGVATGIDNTWATPMFFNPIAHGIDVVAHSATKYMNGHSDTLAGVVCGSRELIQHVKEDVSIHNGTTLSPFNAWLVLRGLRTLPLRMKQIDESTRRILKYFDKQPAVAKINHPLCADAAQRTIFEKYFSGTSGLFSIELRDTSYEKISAFINSLNIFQIGCSWGGFESLIISLNREHNEAQMVEDGLSPGIIRISIGLEDADDLLADLDTAFRAIQ